MASANAKITLAGKDYPVTKLSFRQLREVIPALTKLLEIIGPAILANRADAESNPLAMLKAFNLTAETFDLILDAIWPTIRKLTPSVTRDQLMDSDIGITELIAALPIVMQMTGFLPDPVDPGEPVGTTEGGDAPKGEASPPSS